MLRYLVVLLYINYNIIFSTCQVNFKKNYRSKIKFLLPIKIIRMIHIVIV
ncbi:hypothetical protein ESA2_CDS102 [Staphylococcus phage ESa2]|nr:hypothetical protein ESA2_CDS102 [Staphylococcus phage ESa2]